MSFHALVPAAGNGFRFGADVPKQYLLLDGKPVLQHALERLQAHFELQHTYVVLARDDHWFEQLVKLPANVTALRVGGPTREESVRNALARVTGVEPHDWIVVHDAVRPCLARDEALRLQRELADDAIGGFLAVPVSDTMKRIGTDARVLHTEPREALFRAQTPQMFRYEVLCRAFAQEGVDRWTDEAHAVEALGLAPKSVPGNPCNVKITYPEDMALAEAILAARTRA